MSQCICFTLLAHVVIPNPFGCRDVVHICGMFSKVHVTVKVITQIAACLLGLASLLFAVWSYGLRGSTLHFTVSSVVLFCWNLHSGPLGWISGMTFWVWWHVAVPLEKSYRRHSLCDFSCSVEGHGASYDEKKKHPCNLEAEHAGNPWKRKCLFWIIVFQGFKNRGNISFW